MKDLKKLFFILFYFIFLNSFGQEGLLIKNIKNGNAWMYEKGARVTYIKFGEDEYTTARLNALLDSSIVFGDDTVKLKEIAGIRKRSPLHKIARAAGIPVMLIGSLFIGDGLIDAFGYHEKDAGTKLFLLGVGIFALGYLPYQLNIQDLTVGFGGEWKLEICRGCLSQ